MATPDYAQMATDLEAALLKNLKGGVKSFEVNGRKFTLESAREQLAVLREILASQAEAGGNANDVTTYAEYAGP